MGTQAGWHTVRTGKVPRVPSQARVESPRMWRHWIFSFCKPLGALPQSFLSKPESVQGKLAAPLTVLSLKTSPAPSTPHPSPCSDPS